MRALPQTACGREAKTSTVNQLVSASKSAVFVGRDRELTLLTAGLDDTLGRRGRLFLVSGEPGIGKSRLADELAARAQEREARVLWGRCWEAGGAPAYWPWVQSLRSYIRELDSDTLRSQLGRGAAAFAQLVPDVGDVVSVPSRAVGTDPETARFQLFEAVVAFLRDGGEDRPLVLILDDLHAADTPSLLLLQFLAAELIDARILVFGAYRDVDPTLHDPLSSAIAELARLPVTQMLALSGLERPEVATFIGASAGLEPHAEVVDAMYDETEGNPLFLGEVVRLLASEKKLAHGALSPFPLLAIPHGIRAVIDHRLGGLREECRSALTLASVLGREFGLEALGLVCASSPSGMLELLEDAIAERVVAPVAGGRLRFSHALIRDVLYDELPPARRIRLHREIGEALERLYQEPEPHLTELAHHFLAAAPAGYVEKAVEYARRAGERAASLLAYEEAVRLFQAAVDVLELHQPRDERTLCELLLELGDAQARSGDESSSRETFVRAADAARRVGAAELLARSALGYGGRFVWARAGTDRHLVPLLEDALTALSPQDSALRVRVMTRLAGALRDQHDRRPRAQLSEEAVEIARRIGEPATLAYALDGRFAAMLWPENPEERLEIATELVAVADAVGDSERTAQGRFYRVEALLELGRITAAETELEAAARLAGELRQPAQLWYATVTRATLALFRGRLDEADELIGDALALGEGAQHSDAVLSRRVQLFTLRWERGQLDGLEELLNSSVVEYPFRPMFRCMLARLYAELGREADARAMLEILSEDDFAALPRTNEWLFSMGFLAEVAQRLDDFVAAQAIYRNLLPHAFRNACTHDYIATGSVSRALGLAAATASQWVDAERHFEDAREMNSRMGARPWSAYTACDWAGMLLRRDGPGDTERAEVLLAGAVETAHELGLATVLERVGALGNGGGDKLRRARVSAAAPSVFRRDGEYWSIAYERDVFRLKDSKGLRYLARLLVEPGRELHALDLVAGEREAGRPTRTSEPGLTSSRLGDAGEALDAQAKAEYRRRLEELEGELDEARAFGDPERAARAEEERDFLVRELAGAVGLGGRDRRLGSPSERARVSVTRAIRSALARFDEHSSALGNHLERTIQTGTFCSYRPDPRAPIDWRV
jgi:tetratricopeptide (TPR) repeat protein